MRLGTLAALLLLCGLAAVAEVGTANTLESMAATAPIILRGACTESRDVKGDFGIATRTVTLRVDEVLKGVFRQPTIQLHCTLFRNELEKLPTTSRGHDFLVFLTNTLPDNVFYGIVPVPATEEKGLKNPWSSARHVTSGVRVCMGGITTTFPAIIDLQAPLHVYSIEALLAETPALPTPRPEWPGDNTGLLTDSNTIVNIVKRWATWKATDLVPVKRSFGDDPGYAIMEGFGGINDFPGFDYYYMVIPAAKEVRERAIALTTAKKPNDRERAARVLQAFSGDESSKALRALLQDPFEIVAGVDLIAPTVYYFPVRAAAAHSLEVLGEKPDEVALRRTDSREEKLRQLHAKWKVEIPQLLGKNWTLKSVSYCAAPNAWRRTAGGDGIAIVAVDSICGSNGPKSPSTFTLFIMPRDWQGRSRQRPANTNDMQLHITTELGADICGRRFFYLMEGNGELVKLGIIRHLYGVTDTSN